MLRVVSNSPQLSLSPWQLLRCTLREMCIRDRPYDARIFKALGGGMHFCGRGDHYIAAACELTGLSCINMSQPELNDMERIYAATIDNDILIIGMPPAEIMRAGRAGRHLHGRCV